VVQHPAEPARGRAIPTLRTRGINVRAIHAVTDGSPLVGFAPARWRILTDSLLHAGVTAYELIDADLAARRNDRLYDTYRGRIIVPVRDGLGRIEGFIGRDITGDPRAAKYRNPTRTATYDKSAAVYRPTRHRLGPQGRAIVVEGVLDALALTAAAAQVGALDLVAPCTTSGLAVSRVQAAKIMTLGHNPVAIALDGDDAGRAGTDRWKQQLYDLGCTATAIQLPDGRDPADWIAEQGAAGLTLFHVPRHRSRLMQPVDPREITLSR
jgi:DNA primase catalytic core